MKKLLLLLTFTCIFLQVFAVTYYISNSGNDASNGKTELTAWKTILKVNTSVVSGDVILFQCGGQWREMLIVPASNLTFSSYGTGAKPIINGANLLTKWTKKSTNIYYSTLPTVTNYGFLFDYICIVNQKMFTQVGSLSQVKVGAYFADKTARRIYVYSTVKPTNTEVSARMFGAGIVSKTGIKFNNIDFRNTCHTGLYFYASGSQINGNSLVTNCTFTQNRNSGIMFDNGYSNNRVENCTSTFNGNGFYSWSDQTYGSDNNVFNHCVSKDNIFYRVGVVTDGHGFGIYNSTNNIVEYCESSNDKYGINIDPANRANSIIIRYNYVHNGQADTPGICVGNIPSGATHQVYYNLIVNVGTGIENYGIWVQGGTRAGAVYLVNNTIFNDASHSPLGIMASTGTNLIVKNNIIYCAATNAGLIGILSGSGEVNNNFYYAPNSTSKMFYFGSYVNSFAQWQSATRQDVNSFYGDPLLNADFTLQPGSQAVNRGFNFGIQTDLKGNPIVGLPDIGSFEKQ